MASTINADNGVVSGTSGLKSTADTSGVLALQSNGTTGLTLNTDLSVTFAGAQTLSTGTANGVTYLNGSKVLTSGSALTFDGTNFATTGNITSGGVLQALTTVQSSSGADLSLNANGANRDVIVKVNGTEQARFVGSTGNLGIGTNSPNRLLSLYATQPVFQITNVASGNTQGTIQYQISGGTDFILDNQGSGTGGNIIFYQAGVERYRFGTSGQLGVGGANYGTSGQVLTSGGSGAAPSWASPAAGGFSNMAVFTSSGTWSVPSGVTKCMVICTGGGGAGDLSSGGSAQGLSGGGAGGTAIKTFTLSGGSASITVGAAGAGASSGGTGGNGGTSSFTYGSTISGSGGSGCSFAQRRGGPGGSGSGGDLNLTGGSGGGGANASAAAISIPGGASYWGGGALDGSGPYGAGGSGVQYSTSVGVQGVIVIYY